MNSFLKKGSWIFLSCTLLLTFLFTLNAFALNTSFQRPLKVAVIDTGISLQNKALSPFIKYAEDFTQTTLLADDRAGHGTHITGIITRGLDPNSIHIYNLKFSDPHFHGDTLKTTLKALQRALDLKVDIVNYSAGGYSISEEERALLVKLGQQNTVVVSAAGNDKVELKNQKYYPASYRLANVVSVGATDASGKMASFSNFDNSLVQIAAPGSQIISTDTKDQKLVTMSGTSQATAEVTHQMIELSAKAKHRIPATRIARMLPFFAQKKASLKNYIYQGRWLNALVWPITIKSN